MGDFWPLATADHSVRPYGSVSRSYALDNWYDDVWDTGYPPQQPAAVAAPGLRTPGRYADEYDDYVETYDEYEEDVAAPLGIEEFPQYRGANRRGEATRISDSVTRHSPSATRGFGDYWATPYDNYAPAPPAPPAPVPPQILQPTHPFDADLPPYSPSRQPYPVRYSRPTPSPPTRVPINLTSNPAAKRYGNGIVEFNDGTLQLPDGTVVQADRSARYRDGTRGNPNPDGSLPLLYGAMLLSDKSIKLQSGVVRLPSGLERYPDGSIHLPDGSLAPPEALRDPEGYMAWWLQNAIIRPAPAPVQPVGTPTCLHVKVLSGKDLLARDFLSSDPYVEILWGNVPTGAKTAYKSSTLNPTWNEEFFLEIPELLQSLTFWVWDADMLGSKDFLGQAALDCRVRKNDIVTLPLAIRPDVPADQKIASKKLGSITIQTEWLPSISGVPKAIPYSGPPLGQPTPALSPARPLVGLILPNLPVNTTVLPDGSLRLSSGMVANRQADGTYQMPDGSRFAVTSLTTIAPPPSSLSPKFGPQPVPAGGALLPPIFQPPAGSGLVLNPSDNSIKLLDGSVLTSAGLLNLPDGTVSIRDAQRGWWRMIDGSALMPNGTIQKPPATLTANKKPEDLRLPAAPAGTQRFTDGTLKFPNGIVQRGADRALLFPDGSTKALNSQPVSSSGSPLPLAGPGRVKLNNNWILESDNSLTLPNGCRKMIDGTVALPGGAVMQRDGRVRLPNGKVVLPDAYGRVVIDEAGTAVSPELSLITPDGMEKKIDGTVGRCAMPNASVNRPVMGVELRPVGDPANPGKIIMNVHSVAPGGPADRAGMKPGDVLRTWDSVLIDSEPAFATKISSCVANQTVLVGLQRGGQMLTTFLILGGGSPLSPTQTRVAAPATPIPVMTLPPTITPTPVAPAAPQSPQFAPAAAPTAPRPTLGMNIQMNNDVRGNRECVAVVQNTVAGGPADQAGIRAGDVLVSWDGTLLTSREIVEVKVRQATPGSTVQMGINRQGEGRTIPVVVGGQGSAAVPPPAKASLLSDVAEAERPTVGFEIKMLDDGRGGRNNVVVVHAVTPGGPCDKAGIVAGDIIERWNGVALDSKEALGQMMRSARIGQVATLSVNRQGQALTKAVTIEGTTQAKPPPRTVVSENVVQPASQYPQPR